MKQIKYRSVQIIHLCLGQNLLKLVEA